MPQHLGIGSVYPVAIDLVCHRGVGSDKFAYFTHNVSQIVDQIVEKNNAKLLPGKEREIPVDLLAIVPGIEIGAKAPFSAALQAGAVYLTLMHCFKAITRFDPLQIG